MKNTMVTKTLIEFTKAQAKLAKKFGKKLLWDYHAKVAELQALHEQLTHHGFLKGGEVGNGKKPKAASVKRRKASGKPRGSWNEERALKILGSDEMPLNKLAKHMDYGNQSLKKKLASMPMKFAVRNAVKGNSRSALLVKAK